MNEFKFLLEKNIDHNIAHDHYIYEEFFLCILKKKFMNDRPFLILTVLNFTDFVNEIYKVGQKWKQWRLIQLIKER